MLIKINNQEYKLPNIGDTIYNIRPMATSYEYYPAVVGSVIVKNNDILIELEESYLCRSVKTFGEFWFIDEDEAKKYCYENKPQYKGLSS